MTTVANDARTQYLTFLLGGEMHAIEILRVREIIEYDELTRVPAMPPAVRGVINLRGRVVPVVDLTEQFTGQGVVISPRTCIVIVEAKSGEQTSVVGIITEAVSEVLDVSEAQRQDAPSFGTNIAAEYLDGLFETDGKTKKLVLMLNVDRALSAVTHKREALAELAPIDA